MASTNIIVAVGKSTELGFPIGVKGNLPWKCKEDMKWFKETTMGHVVIMGRNTYDSIGGPLTGRKNIIVTSKDVDYNGSAGITGLDGCDSVEITMEDIVYSVLRIPSNITLSISSNGNLF